MRRVLVTIWGAEGGAYVGRRLTLFRNPKVKFAGEPVGGIQISHASDIAEPIQIALTETRGKRSPFRVEPLPAEKAAEPMPAGWAEWTNEERGANRAATGLDALASWWKTLTAAEQHKLKSLLDSEWKPTAQKKGGTP